MLAAHSIQSSVYVDEVKLIHLFSNTYRRGILGQIWSKLTRRSSDLLDLAEVEASGKVVARHHGGSQCVPVQQIQGSVGRTHDFDRNFNPVRNHIMQRWVKVAAYWMSDATLPAIKLIRVGDTYYVEDGHHRVSIAHALGQTHIDAEVTVWEVAKNRPDQRSSSKHNLLIQPA